MMNNQIYNNQQGGQLPAEQAVIDATGVTDIATPKQTSINPRQINPTPISPKAFSNQNAINGVYGRANQGSFTRSVPIAPPAGVETSITPDLGIENQ